MLVTTKSYRFILERERDGQGYLTMYPRGRVVASESREKAVSAIQAWLQRRAERSGTPNVGYLIEYGVSQKLGE